MNNDKNKKKKTQSMISVFIFSLSLSLISWEEQTVVMMFLKNQAQMSFSWFFHTGWLETGHDCSTKEGDLFGLFI